MLFLTNKEIQNKITMLTFFVYQINESRFIKNVWSLFNNSTGTNCISTCERIKLNHYLTSYLKTNWKLINGLNISAKNHKTDKESQE